MFTSCWKQEFLFVTSRGWWAFLCDLQMYFLWYVVSLTQMIKDHSNWRLGAWPIESHSFIFWRVIFLWICLKCEKGHADKKRLWIKIKETKTKLLWTVIEWKTNHLYSVLGTQTVFTARKHQFHEIKYIDLCALDNRPSSWVKGKHPRCEHCIENKFLVAISCQKEPLWISQKKAFSETVDRR